MDHMILKNWRIEQLDNGRVVVYGQIYNDVRGRFADGTLVRTSAVLKADFVRGVIKTKNSTYRLEIGD